MCVTLTLLQPETDCIILTLGGLLLPPPSLRLENIECKYLPGEARTAMVAWPGVINACDSQCISASTTLHHQRPNGEFLPTRQPHY